MSSTHVSDPVKSNTLLYQYRYLLSFFAIGVVYICNMFIDVMDVDAGQYASIAREMFASGSYLEVYHRGTDYLDKPPMLFWLAALSFRVFGISNFAFKLPAILSLVLGIYSTYKFTTLWYDHKRGLTAALILATTQGMLLMSNDIRTDGILMGFVMFTIWQLSLFIQQGGMKHVLLGAIGAAVAMMTKGPIGLLIPGLAIGSHILAHREWKLIFKYEWAVFLVIILLLLLPMCYGLYEQFDLHPEKEVYGLKGPSGIKFFFWTQSFGRITGDNYWKNDSGYFYFFSTILWDFQPWLLLIVPAIFLKVKRLIKRFSLLPKKEEYMTVGGFCLTFAALSLSGYKLPHYIFPIFPLLSILCADYLHRLAEEANIRWLKFFKWAQFGLIILFFVALVLLMTICFPVTSVLLWMSVAGLFLLCLWVFFKSHLDFADTFVFPTLIMISAVALVMSVHFYPALLKYQAPSICAKEVKEMNLAANQFYFLHFHTHSMDFL